MYIENQTENMEGHPSLGLLINLTYPPLTNCQVNPSHLILKAMESFEVSSIKSCCGILLTDLVQMGFRLLVSWYMPLARSPPFIYK